MNFKEQTLRPNPLAKANPISKLLYLWILPLFRRGYRKELEISDLYGVLPHEQTHYVGDKLQKYWQQELDHDDRSPSLLRAIIKMSWRTALVVSLVFLVNQCVIVVAQPVILRYLILTFDDPHAESWKAYAYTGAISVLVFLSTFTMYPADFATLRLAMKLRVATSSLIYRKSLKLSKTAQNETSQGQIVNLLANDCNRFDLNFWFLPYIVSAPFQVAILMYLLYTEIGTASMVGVAFIVLLLPLQYYLGKFSARFRLKIAKRTDERSHLMHEIIMGMRVIKQYAWETPFSLLIHKARKLEVKELRKRGLLQGSFHAIFYFAPKLAQYFTFLVFVLVEQQPMTAERVFFTLTCLYQVLQIMMRVAAALAGLGDILVGVKRIEEFLLLDEQRTNNCPNAPKTDYEKEDELTHLISSAANEPGLDQVQNSGIPRVSLQSVCASWTEEGRRTLDNVTFSVEGDKLVMVVGPVGSSKTSLLHAIITELPLSSGNLSVDGSLSYASQEPWIFGGNLRQNILFGLPFEEAHYRATLKACALEEDLLQLPYGDMTVVGERGVALSGGQKARVNLARALYRKCDIYLMDDPLSAVDTCVSRHLFEKCIKEHLRGAIRILVTHQLQYLPQADHILVLNQGQILAQGTFQQLIDAGIDFVSLLGTSKGIDDTVTAGEDRISQTSEATREPEENQEEKVGGSVNTRTYRDYLMSGHSVFGFLSILLTFTLTQLSCSGADVWLSFWTNAEQQKLDKGNHTDCASACDDDAVDTYLGQHIYLYVYTGLVVAVSLFALIRGPGFYMYCATISVSIHDKMFRSMVRAPIKFFDDNPSGRIMNRFTKDVAILDELLPVTLLDTLTIFLQMFGVMCIVIISNYYMSLPTVILLLMLWLIRRIFIPTARAIKRIESITRSPLFIHVSATLHGLTTIRACKAQNELIKQFEAHQDFHTSSWLLFLAANRCFGIWLEIICNTFLAVAAFSFLLISTSKEGGNVGLAISSLLNIMGAFQWGMRQSAETENYMTSVERALEYSKLKPEADLESSDKHKPPKNWPKFGEIEFRNVSLSYDGEKQVLMDLTFEIRPSEKIGIVGRTGAGKSSIIAALFRLTEPEGEIRIDNVDIKNIGLHDLRKAISIIPQDPVLFSGTVRYNLDPFNQFQDDHLWRVIEVVELKEQVTSLDYHVADGGSNFSVGQRQLVCLARAILRKNRILVMDEATANVDPRTDNLIQQTIRSKFADCTLITIAHRLHSIIDCDRILVLDHGQLKEYDHPHTLLQNEEGVFTGMVKQTGASTSAMLRKMAGEAFSFFFHEPY